MQAYGQDQMRMDDSSCTKHVGIWTLCKPWLKWFTVINSDTSSLSIASMISIKLHTLTDEDERLEHCRALSSDEDSFCEAEREVSKDRDPLSFSSGYSSVQSVSPSSTASSSPPSLLMPCTFKTFTTSLGAASANATPGFRLLVPMQRPRGTSSKQVKRKNSAAHSGGEVEVEEEGKGDKNTAGAGFLSL